ncbi:MAG: flagellar export chaperone FliS [Terriglobales bacterium]
MTKNQTELTYLRAGVQSASSVGLVIVLYDLLVGDLKAAIAAIEKRDVEERSRHLKHAFLVLEQMEQSLDMENGGEAASHLSSFYASLRSNIMSGHVKASADILNRQIQLVFQVRGAWVQVEQREQRAALPASAAPTFASQPNDSEGELVHPGSGWTA